MQSHMPSSVRVIPTVKNERAEKELPPSPAFSPVAQPRAFSTANGLPKPSCLHRHTKLESCSYNTSRLPVLRTRCFEQHPENFRMESIADLTSLRSKPPEIHRVTRPHVTIKPVNHSCSNAVLQAVP